MSVKLSMMNRTDNIEPRSRRRWRCSVDQRDEIVLHCFYPVSQADNLTAICKDEGKDLTSIHPSLLSTSTPLLPWGSQKQQFMSSFWKYDARYGQKAILWLFWQMLRLRYNSWLFQMIKFDVTVFIASEKLVKSWGCDISPSLCWANIVLLHRENKVCEAEHLCSSTTFH